MTVCLDLDQEWVDFVIFLDWDFLICQDFWTWSPSINLDKILIISINLDCLKKSWLSWFIHIVSILKIATERKTFLILTGWIILTTFKSWSQHQGQSRSRPRLVSTSIGLDCQDPQPYLQHVYCFIIFIGFFHSFPFILSSFSLPMYLP